MADAVELDVDGRRVRVSSPDKPMFPQAGITKLELVDYYLAVAPALLPHCLGRPCNLERHPDGVGGKSFMQKRVPANAPEWLRTAEVSFGSGRSAEELCPASIADVLWSVNLGCVTVHPWSVRLPDLEQPDELRVDLDPSPGVSWSTVRAVTQVINEVLVELGMTGFAKTSGSRGMHVVVRVEPRPYVEVRAAAVALAREVERRRPDIASSSWWKEQRGERVFVDFNQNLWDRTTACAYAVRAVPEARVSFPIRWDELADVEPGDATVRTVPTLLEGRDDPIAALDAHASDLGGLLELAERDRAAGVGEAPLPPHYPRFPDEPPRVPPSRARRSDGRAS